MISKRYVARLTAGLAVGATGAAIGAAVAAVTCGDDLPTRAPRAVRKRTVPSSPAPTLIPTPAPAGIFAAGPAHHRVS